jgi:5S rRNA maturation endonuclease (ribonuclease M5)
MFDSVKKDFLLLLEELDFPPVTIAGLFSLGTIVSIPFSGPLVGSMSQYQFGTVHSVTDHNVFADDFTTTASTLWLVENRGVITRFAYEKDFLKDTNSLVIGVEGQLKSSVKRLLSLVAQCSSVEQVLIWTDYDEAGVTIADHVYKELMEATNPNLTYKWIVPDQPRVVKDVQSYHEAIKKYLSKRRGEQEEQMEGVNEWLTWMKN